jgi:methanethiol S-methyltransferase
MKRALFLIYGGVCYALFLAVYAWLAAFVGNLFLPWTIDRRAGGWPLAAALAVDLALVALFCVQHSLMARRGFKQAAARVIPQPIERSTYVLASCVVVVVLMLCWQPIDVVVWRAPEGLVRWLLWGAFAAGWLAVPAVSLMINHFDLFGARQVWLYWQGKEYTPPPFHEPLAYRFVRHPLYVGWAVAFWAIPTMTLGHLLFAGALTAYMLAASKIEERDLVQYYGHAYLDYRRRVPAFVPRLIRPQAEKEVGQSAGR